MLLYVMSKTIFNQFASISCPLDQWTVADIICAVTNIFCFNYIQTITPDDVLDYGYRGSKQVFNMMMVATIIATWLRVFGIFMVIKTFSLLLLTVIKMLGSAKTFMFILGLYLTVMAMIFLTLF